MFRVFSLSKPFFSHCSCSGDIAFTHSPPRPSPAALLSPDGPGVPAHLPPHLPAPQRSSRILRSWRWRRRRREWLPPAGVCPPSPDSSSSTLQHSHHHCNPCRPAVHQPHSATAAEDSNADLCNAARICVQQQQQQQWQWWRRRWCHRCRRCFVNLRCVEPSCPWLLLLPRIEDLGDADSAVAATTAAAAATATRAVEQLFNAKDRADSKVPGRYSDGHATLRVKMK